MNEENKNILIDIPVPIVTPRLILRPLQAGDGAALTAAKAETWEDLTQWMAWTDKGQDADADEAYVRNCHAEFILRKDITLLGLEKDTNRPVIWTGLHRFDWTLRHFEIGYWVRKSAQGQGYATESTNALIRYAFNALNAKRMKIHHAKDNDASRTVIEKLGFEREAIKKQAHELPDGRIVDEYCYVRLNTDNLPPLDIHWGPG